MGELYDFLKIIEYKKNFVAINYFWLIGLDIIYKKTIAM